MARVPRRPIARAGTPAGLTLAARRLACPLALGLLPVVVMSVIIVAAALAGTLGMDFTGGVLHGSHATLHGHTPYHPEHFELIAESAHTQRSPVIEETSMPPAALLAATPLALLPSWWAIAAATVLAFVLPALTLLILDVSDWRCYGAMYLSLPIVHSISLGNTTPLVMLCLALCWRWRDHAVRCGAALAVVLSFKLIGLPLLVWLVARRRRGAAGIAVLVTAGVNLAAWAIVGFDEVRPYQSVLSGLTRAQQDSSYLPGAVAYNLGLAAHQQALVVAVAGLLLLGVWRVSRRVADDARTFALVVLATLALMPFVHQLYFALLLVPIAIARPRFGWSWLLLLPFWLYPYEGTGGLTRGFVLAGLILAAYIVVTLRKVRNADGSPTVRGPGGLAPLPMVVG